MIKAQCFKIYQQAFGKNEPFDSMLFEVFSDCIETLSVDGSVASMLFKIPCELQRGAKKDTAYYIYAVATDKQHQGKGYMTALINRICQDGEVYFLKPADDNLKRMYKKIGFNEVAALPRGTAQAEICVGEKHKTLSELCDIPGTRFTLMFYGTVPCDSVMFKDTLE